jgi:hypothetical protein
MVPDEQLVRQVRIQVRIVSDGTCKVPAVDELVVNGQPHQGRPREITPRKRNRLLQRALGSERDERTFDALVIGGDEVTVGEALDRGLFAADSGNWTGRDACQWLRDQRSAGSRIVGVELPEEAVRLADLPAARQRTIAVLGHERTGIPAEAVDLLDVAVEIPMVGSGASLNVAVAGSLVLYRLAGLI